MRATAASPASRPATSLAGGHQIPAQPCGPRPAWKRPGNRSPPTRPALDRAEGTLELARELREVPNTDPSNATRFDKLVDDTDDSPPLQAWASTYAVAERLGFPLYSDDRYIRAQARRDGIPAFGTVAILEALVERGRLSADDYKLARQRLRASGALGVVPDEQEFVEEAREAGWRLTESLRQLLLDPTGWTDANAMHQRHLALLRAVYEDEPDELAAWVARILDAARIVQPGRALGRYAVLLLASAWANEEPAFFHALIDAIDEARDELGYFADPLPLAFGLVLGAGLHLPGPMRAGLFAQMMRKLRTRDQLRAFEVGW
jgi:hypothetical protein